MEIKVAWTFKGKRTESVFHDTDADRKAANELWTMLRNMDGVTDLYPAPKTTAEKHIVVQVLYSGSNKTYTFRSPEKLSANQKCFVFTSGEFKKVTVAQCGELTKAEIAQMCPTPFEKLGWIQGRAFD